MASRFKSKLLLTLCHHRLNQGGACLNLPLRIVTSCSKCRGQWMFHSILQLRAKEPPMCLLFFFSIVFDGWDFLPSSADSAWFLTQDSGFDDTTTTTTTTKPGSPQTPFLRTENRNGTRISISVYLRFQSEIGSFPLRDQRSLGQRLLSYIGMKET